MGMVGSQSCEMRYLWFAVVPTAGQSDVKQSQNLKRQHCAIIVFGLVLLPGSWRAFGTKLCCVSSFPTPNCRVLGRWDRIRIAFPLLKLSVREEMNLSSQILVHQTCASRSHSGLFSLGFKTYLPIKQGLGAEPCTVGLPWVIPPIWPAQS